MCCEQPFLQLVRKLTHMDGEENDNGKESERPSHERGLWCHNDQRMDRAEQVVEKNNNIWIPTPPHLIPATAPLSLSVEAEVDAPNDALELTIVFIKMTVHERSHLSPEMASQSRALPPLIS
jgi:hypothetical protein